MDRTTRAPGLKMTGQLRANWTRQIQSRTGGTISLLVLAFGGGALALALAAEWAGLRFNDSPSMPTGLYVRTSSESSCDLGRILPGGALRQAVGRARIQKPWKLPGWCRATGQTDSGSSR